MKKLFYVYPSRNTWKERMTVIWCTLMAKPIYFSVTDLEADILMKKWFPKISKKRPESFEEKRDKIKR